MNLVEALEHLSGGSASPSERLLEALAMYEEGVALQQMNFQRRYPHLSENELNDLLEKWLRREEAH